MKRQAAKGKGKGKGKRRKVPEEVEEKPNKKPKVKEEIKPEESAQRPKVEEEIKPEESAQSPETDLPLVFPLLAPAAEEEVAAATEELAPAAEEEVAAAAAEEEVAAPAAEEEVAAAAAEEEVAAAAEEAAIGSAQKRKPREVAERKVGFTRYGAEELKELLPPVPLLYIKYHVADRKVWVDFTSLKDSGIQRTKTASWPHRYSGVREKALAVSKVLDFVDAMWKKHFNGSDDEWRKPSFERIQCQTQKLVDRLAASPQ